MQYVILAPESLHSCGVLLQATNAGAAGSGLGMRLGVVWE